MMLRQGLKWALGLSPLLWLMPPLQPWVESRMSVVMALQIPLLVLAGFALARLAPARLRTALARVDQLGLTSALGASLVLTYWMIPLTLDQAVLDPGVRAARLISCLVAGLALGGGQASQAPLVFSFFLGNTAWMTITAGFLYSEAGARLCANYLIDDQALAGSALITIGFALGAAGLWTAKQAIKVSKGIEARSA